MSERQVIYEAKLTKTGTMLTWGGLLAMALLGGIGWIFYFVVGSSGLSFSVVWTIVWVVVILFAMRKVVPLRNNQGVHRISIDDYGLYVHSDVPALAPSFLVIALDIARMVHTTIKSHEGGDEHEYFVETKSGKRYRIEELLLVKPQMRAMELFEKIANRFHWVEIAEEVK